MKFRHHKYTWTKPFGSVQHHWELLGPNGGIHFHFTETESDSPRAGLEFHHTRSANMKNDVAPDHINCFLTGEPCWHDGTSLYATEDLLPQIRPMLRGGNHKDIFTLLEWEYNSHFDELMGA